jgi:hypothetical protein
MVGFGLLVIAAAAGLNHGVGDLAVLAGALALVGGIGLYLVADLRSTSSGFPWPDGELSGAAPTPPRASSEIGARAP